MRDGGLYSICGVLVFRTDRVWFGGRVTYLTSGLNKFVGTAHWPVTQPGRGPGLTRQKKEKKKEKEKEKIKHKTRE